MFFDNCLKNLVLADERWVFYVEVEPGEWTKRDECLYLESSLERLNKHSSQIIRGMRNKKVFIFHLVSVHFGV